MTLVDLLKNSQKHAILEVVGTWLEWRDDKWIVWTLDKGAAVSRQVIATRHESIAVGAFMGCAGIEEEDET